MHSDWYYLWTHYWWLIFPLFWMVVRIIQLSLGHSHANRALDIIKSYADQGKEPPPEVLAALKDRRDPEERWSRRPERGWGRFFLFSALAVAFTVVAFIPNDLSDGHQFAFVFVAIIMVGLALGGLASALMKPRLDQPPQDRPQ
ncbi:MAG: hypothetical protein ABI608_02415 [Rhizomicrobium sp.]